MMSKSTYTVRFPRTDFAPIELPANQNLSEYLTVQNSPVLFGCRTGLCGTCAVAIVGHSVVPTLSEQEILEIYAPDVPNARLACQVSMVSDLEIMAIEVRP
jgi:ferredoxin